MENFANQIADFLLRMGISEDMSMFFVKIGSVLIILLVAFLLDWICRKVIVPAVRKVTSKTESSWDDLLLNDEVLKNLCRLVPPITMYVLFPLVLSEGNWLNVAQKLCGIYATIVVVRFICVLLSSIYTISSEHERLKEHSMKGFYQMLKLLVVCIGVIVVISILIDRSPVAILTGLGAGTAILMLVFQDTIKGLVAGVQLMANDMLRPGDWITVPKYGADGDVMEVSLTAVKVRNWDKTIVTLPPYALVNDSFQNWRGMFDMGGRRIKRSINIDMNTVRFCTAEEMDNFRNQQWMDGFEPTADREVNLYIFRYYIEHYLRNHPKVNTNMIMTVRQLQPTPQGLPIELYFFSADTSWLRYEHLQAEVFDHVLAVLHNFDLRVFQSPAGNDLTRKVS